MLFYMKCECGATATVTGREEPGLPVVIFREDPEWEGGDPECDHFEDCIVNRTDEDNPNNEYNPEDDPDNYQPDPENDLERRYHAESARDPRAE